MAHAVTTSVGSHQRYQHEGKVHGVDLLSPVGLSDSEGAVYQRAVRHHET
jgi:hypothetical protein